MGIKYCVCLDGEAALGSIKSIVMFTVEALMGNADLFASKMNWNIYLTLMSFY